MKILQILLGSIEIFWIYSGSYIYFVRLAGKEPYLLIRTMFHELKPFYLPSVVLLYLLSSFHEVKNAGDIILLFINALGYWIYKDIDKDDRWKRRKERLAEKVTQVGSRLEVVPAK